MLSWLPSIPYPSPDQPGFWDPVTSTLQWCEEDYYATYYSAEVVNTVTNFLYFYLTYVGIKSCRKNGHDSVFVVTYLGYFLVGFGSMMFHTTLKYPWQLVDELNMVYTTCLMIYVAISYRRSKPFRIALAIFLFLFCGFLTAYYHYLQDPTFHQNVYAGLTVFVIVRSMYLMESSLRPSLRVKNKRYMTEHGGRRAALTPERRKYEDDRDYKILMNMWTLVVYGVAFFLLGLAIWALDNKFCSYFRIWRRKIGMPWGFFLEGHGWWHLMTGVGAYSLIVWGIHLRHVLDGDQEQFRMHWPKFYNFPEIVRVPEVLTGNKYLTDEKSAVGHGMNGHALNGKAIEAGVVNGHLTNGKTINGKALNGKAINGKAINGKVVNGTAHKQTTNGKATYGELRRKA